MALTFEEALNQQTIEDSIHNNISLLLSNIINMPHGLLGFATPLPINVGTVHNNLPFYLNCKRFPYQSNNPDGMDFQNTLANYFNPSNKTFEKELGLLEEFQNGSDLIAINSNLHIITSMFVMNNIFLYNIDNGSYSASALTNPIELQFLQKPINLLAPSVFTLIGKELAKMGLVHYNTKLSKKVSFFNKNLISEIEFDIQSICDEIFSSRQFKNKKEDLIKDTNTYIVYALSSLTTSCYSVAIQNISFNNRVNDLSVQLRETQQQLDDLRRITPSDVTLRTPPVRNQSPVILTWA